MKGTKKKELKTAEQKREKLNKDINSPPARMDHVDELWDEITEINKAISRIYNRLGLE